MMRVPNNTGANHNEKLYDYPVYKDDEKSILTPISFYNSDNQYLEYDGWFRMRGHKTYPNLLNRFQGRDSLLETFKIRDKNYLAGNGIIFRYQVNEDTTKTLFPIVILCYDEDSLIENSNVKKLTFVVNTLELNSEMNKSLKGKLVKMMESCVKEDEFSIIYTNNVEKWCFSPNPKLKFKSIKEQGEFLQQLVEETV